MKTFFVYTLLIIFLLPATAMNSFAQRPNVLQGLGDRIGNLSGQGGSGGGTGDSLRNRSKEQDTIAIKFYFFDSTKAYQLDSTISDYTVRYPIPATHLFLGNTGSATKSILFAPYSKPGWDAGFHAFDVYKWKLDDVRFFNTTRPYTELGYLLGGRAEQIIDVMHTQNLKPNLNFSFQYRLINAPGVYRNQKTNHNNYLFNFWYQSVNKRYNNYFIVLSNKLQAGENGGLKNVDDLRNPIYNDDSYTIPTNIGGQPSYGTDFFNTTISTGNKYTETNFLLRQQYDFGKKDSLVSDSIVLPLFYPRLRFEHTFKYGNYKYLFQDISAAGSRQSNEPDSAYYNDRYNINFAPGNDSIFIQDRWKEISNDFSIYQFPDSKNLQQFIKLGAEIQLLNGTLRNTQSLYNFIGHAEYRNRTKNQKWNITALGKLFMTGSNFGDYHAYINLQRLLSQKLGSLQVGFENVNRSPSYIFNTTSNFYLAPAQGFNKENIVHFFGSFFQPKLGVQLGADYYLMTNYLYFKNFYQPRQEGSPFNVLRLSASKTFTFFKRIKWRAEVYVQQKTGAVELNLPLFYTRNRIAYEGKLGFKNLNIAIGTEIRYQSPYKADNYSPVMGKFFYQDSITIANYPQIDAFMHLRIRGFRLFLRFDNLNAAAFGKNFVTPENPFPGLLMRFGIHWSFVN